MQFRGRSWALAHTCRSLRGQALPVLWAGLDLSTFSKKTLDKLQRMVAGNEIPVRSLIQAVNIGNVSKIAADLWDAERRGRIVEPFGRADVDQRTSCITSLLRVIPFSSFAGEDVDRSVVYLLRRHKTPLTSLSLDSMKVANFTTKPAILSSSIVRLHVNHMRALDEKLPNAIAAMSGLQVLDLGTVTITPDWIQPDWARVQLRELSIDISLLPQEHPALFAEFLSAFQTTLRKLSFNGQGMKSFSPMTKPTTFPCLALSTLVVTGGVVTSETLSWALVPNVRHLRLGPSDTTPTSLFSSGAGMSDIVALLHCRQPQHLHSLVWSCHRPQPDRQVDEARDETHQLGDLEMVCSVKGWRFDVVKPDDIGRGRVAFI